MVWTVVDKQGTHKRSFVIENEIGDKKK